MNNVSLIQALSSIKNYEATDLDVMPQIQLRCLRNITLEQIEIFLKYHLYTSGIKASIEFGDFDTIQQEILDSSSPLYKDQAPEVILIALELSRLFSTYDQADAETYLAQQEQWFSLLDHLSTQSSSLILINTFMLPLHSEHGIASTGLNNQLSQHIQNFNQALQDYTEQHPHQFFLIDWNRLLRLLGQSQSLDYRQWYLSQAPFRPAFLNLYALEVTKVCRALKGKAKKCLILDCDDTLWGGIIGEEGLDGIQLNNQEYPGKAFYDFQKSVLQLKERGVLLCLCSKNNEADVRNVLEKHPHCLLSTSDLAAWRINWEPKPDNIKSLAEELNLGLEHLVFIDDSAIECDMVQQILPQVLVQRVPEALSEYSSILWEEGWFDTLSQSKEDQQRTQMYQDTKKRQQAKQRFQDLDSYLESIQLKAQITPAATADIPRVAQLTQKTNQFNLTTKRYSEADIQSILENAGQQVLTLKPHDKFGDFGLTGVLISIYDKAAQTIHIDTLLLSCRILGRRLEQCFVQESLQWLSQKYIITTWTAEYLQTAKNEQVRHFWEAQGFTETSESQENQRKFELQESDRKYQPISFIELF